MTRPVLPTANPKAQVGLANRPVSPGKSGVAGAKPKVFKPMPPKAQGVPKRKVI